MQHFDSAPNISALLDVMAARAAALSPEESQVWGHLVVAGRALQQALVLPPSGASAMAPTGEPGSFALPHALKFLWEHWKWLRPDDASPPGEEVHRPPYAALLPLQRAMTLVLAEAQLAGTTGKRLHGSLGEFLTAAVRGLPEDAEQWGPAEKLFIRHPKPVFEQYTGPPQACTLREVHRHAVTCTVAVTPAVPYSELHKSVKAVMPSQLP